MDLVKQIYEKARQFDMCNLFTGNETVDELIDIFLSPQGMEFCQRNDFPDIATFRLFLPYNVERRGIYIDAGEITLENAQKTVLIGDTHAKIDCSECKLYNIVLLKGASADINARGWSVVHIDSGEGCKVKYVQQDNSRIL